MRNVALLAVALLVFSGCADSVDFTLASEYEEVGFWSGLWHGMIIVVSFVLSLLDDSVSIYAIYNNGGWYDLGFVLGLMMVLGGSNQTYCKRKFSCNDDKKHTKITIDVEQSDKTKESK
jgi:hypothetical protein